MLFEVCQGLTEGGEMRDSWYTELSGVHYKLGKWWVPEREEQGIILYRGYEYAPPGASQKLSVRQKKLFRIGEEELSFILTRNELDGDEPRFIFPLYRQGREVGIVQEYICGAVRVVKHYMYTDYGSVHAAYAACCRDDAFRAFLNQYHC